MEEAVDCLLLENENPDINRETVLMRQQNTVQKKASSKLEKQLELEETSMKIEEEIELPSLEGYSWYFGDIGRLKAEDFISKQRCNCLLVRDSAQERGYVVTLLNFVDK